MIIDDIQITVIKSARKTIAIQIKPDGKIYVRAPFDMTDSEVYGFVSEKSEWIKKNLKKLDNIKQKTKPSNPLTQNEINELKQKALLCIPQKIEHFADLIGVRPAKITVRNQKTRWGSCSKSGNISINCLVMLMPEKVIDYIVVHELCHLKEMNHSKSFWREVERIIPDYKQRQNWLKENGSQIMMLNISRKTNNNTL